MKTLLQAIEDGKILGPAVYQSIDVPAVLDGRDKPPFEDVWIGTFKLIQSKVISGEASVMVDRIREAAYMAVFQHTSNPDLAGYVSDDFELIGKALFLGIDDQSINALFKEYTNDRIPSGLMKPTNEPLTELLRTASSKPA